MKLNTLNHNFPDFSEKGKSSSIFRCSNLVVLSGYKFCLLLLCYIGLTLFSF